MSFLPPVQGKNNDVWVESVRDRQVRQELGSAPGHPTGDRRRDPTLVYTVDLT